MSNINNLEDMNLVEDINLENGSKKVESYIGEMANITESLLNKYEGMVKIKVKSAGEEKEVYKDEEYLKVDSSNWEVKEIDGIKFKINQEGDVTEYLESALAGEQLFTLDAAIRELKKQGKRLPNTEEEMDAIILAIQKEDNKISPGYRSFDECNFYDRKISTYLWFINADGSVAVSNYIEGDNSKVNYTADSQTFGFSVMGIKD